MINLVRSELLKIRTTHAWWILGLGAFVMTGLAITYNIIAANYLLHEGATGEPGEMDAQQIAEAEAMRDVVGRAADIYTSGQFFGLLFVMLIGALLVTNEFHHQMATTTFLTTPRRTSVIISKLIAASLVGVGFWLVTTVLDLISGAIYLEVAGFGHQLGEGGVIRALLLNLLAYVLWTVFGVGFGTLISNQIGAIVTALVLYLLGTYAASVILMLVSMWLDSQAVLKWSVLVPSLASQLMITGVSMPSNPPQWVGAAVLIGYALVTGAIGIMLTRRRDIA